MWMSKPRVIIENPLSPRHKTITSMEKQGQMSNRSLFHLEITNIQSLRHTRHLFAVSLQLAIVKIFRLQVLLLNRKNPRDLEANNHLSKIPNLHKIGNFA